MFKYYAKCVDYFIMEIPRVNSVPMAHHMDFTENNIELS